jgi:hypothetical protein
VLKGVREREGCHTKGEGRASPPPPCSGMKGEVPLGMKMVENDQKNTDIGFGFVFLTTVRKRKRKVEGRYTVSKLPVIQKRKNRNEDTSKTIDI